MGLKKQAKILAIIPARAGSKAIPNKNIKLFKGKPLLYWTIKIAKKVKAIDRLLVSTDSPKIAQLAKKYRAEAPFLRPKKISLDNSPVILTFQHALKFLKEKENYQPTAVLCLQATSPFRTKEQIEKAIKLFQADANADCLVSVQLVPHNFLPQKLMKLKGKYLEPDLCLKNKKLLHRQTMPLLYARNGPSILIAKTELILKGKFYSRKTLPFIIEDLASNLDIDSPEDLQLARTLSKIRF